MSQNTVPERIGYLDVAKVIVAFLVVFGHFYSPDSDASILRRFIYTFHMPFFFFISGMFHHYGWYSLQKSLVKYAKTLIFPACFFIILYIVIVPPVVGIIDGEGGYFLLLLKAIKLQLNELVTTTHLYYNSVCWFLLSLFTCKLLADILYLNKYIGALFILGILFICWKIHSGFFYSLQAIIALPFYFMGGVIKSKLRLLQSLKYKPIIAVLLGLLCFALMCLNGRVSLLAHMFGNLPIPLNVCCFYLNAIIGSLAVIMLAMTANLKSPFITGLAQSLITILGFQAFLLKPFLQWLDGYTFGVLLKIVVSIAIVVICYGVHLVIMRYIPIVLGKGRVADEK